MARTILVLIALLALGTASRSDAQTGELRDHIGREFYVAFGPNTGGEQPESETENALILEMISAKPATVKVKIPALSFSQSVDLAPGVPARVQLPNGNANTPSAAFVITDGETVVKDRAVHVDASEDITLFALCHKRFSEDAFLVLPVDALGTEYRVVSYETSDIGQGAEMPGQFMIVAVNDQTTVTITPRSITARKKPANTSFQVLLDRGDCYLVQSDILGNEDLTGSHIVSNQPIAVFSGHERAAIPVGAKLYDGSSASRDHLIEQLPPVSACGDTFFVVPFTTSSRPDLMRVIATADETSIYFNGTLTAQLDAGQFYEQREVTAATMVTTSKPVLVAQYMSTTLGKLGDATFPAYGDPSMMLVPPVEQYLKSYDFHCFEAPAAVEAVFVTMVVPVDASETLLDGRSIEALSTLPGTSYGTVTRKIDPGHHTLTSTSPIAAYIYAFSGVASYAMPAGMGVEPGGQTRSGVARETTKERSVSMQISTGGHIFIDPSIAGEIMIFDLAGRMMPERLSSQSGQVDVSELTSGIYFYKSTDGRLTGSFLVP